ncbi:hypothetical protein DFJ74DRAFT_654300 [Hyaloraphidium curvatum]|nr:hypothetical protein DFJ74DRAFT_654300 [Hyaloraphidium curvatum]
MLHALAARHPDSEKLASLVGDVAAEDYLPGQQPAVGEHLAAALDELPPELALSLRAVQSRPQQGDVQRLWDYFASGSALAKGKERILRRRAVVENLLRVTPSAPPQLHKQLFHIIAVAVGRPGDTELLESLSALVVAVQDLRTHLNLGPLLQAVKDPVPAAVVVKEVRKFLSDPEQAESMLRMGKWGALGVLLEIALRHRHLRQLVVDAYILLLGLGYDSQFKPLDLIKIRQRFLAELVGIMSLDADTARSVMSWTMSPDSEDVLDGELRSHLLRVFLSSTQPSPLPEPCLRFLLSNLSRIRAQEPSLQAFSHRLGRTGLSGMLRPVVLENDGWDGLASDMEASGEIAPGTGAAVGDVVLI